MNKHRLNDATHFIEHYGVTINKHCEPKNINQLPIEIDNLQRLIKDRKCFAFTKTICIFKIKFKNHASDKSNT